MPVAGFEEPDAQTQRLVAVIAHLASSDSPTPRVAYDDVHIFGDIMEQKRSSVCTQQTMASFPEDPNAFIAAYPTAFGPEDPPVECRVSLSAIVERCRKEVTPCRNTNQHIREHTTKQATPNCALAAQAPSDPMSGMLLSILERFMFQKGHASLGSELASHRASLGEQPLVGERRSPRGSQLAIEAPPLVDRDEGASGSSPAPMFSGGVAPTCLDPCHDKLAKLQAKLGCVDVGDAQLEDGERGAGSSDEAAAPLPRLLKKRPVAAEDAGEENDESEEQEEVVMKKPAAAAKRARKSAPAPKGPRTTTPAPKATTSIHEALLKKSPKVARPLPSQKPTAHAGGKIYWSKPKGVYRVYLRAGDRIDKQVKANVASKDDMRHKFLICCALIENDKRPR